MSKKQYLQDAAEDVVKRLPDGYTFILLAAPIGTGGRLGYVSNMQREDAINVLKEWLFKASGEEEWMKHDRKCTNCGTPIYQGVLCADCHSKIDDLQPTTPTPAGRDTRLQFLFDQHNSQGALVDDWLIDTCQAILELEQQRDAALEAKEKAERQAEEQRYRKNDMERQRDDEYQALLEQSKIIQDLRTQLTQAQAENGVMREALEDLKPKGGCYCEAQFSMGDGSHPRHTPECEKAKQALSGQSANALLKELEELRQQSLDGLVLEIGQWADETFARNGDYRGKSIVAHLCKEVIELSEDPRCMEEVADCVILLAHLAHQNEQSLTEAIKSKMAINRKRVWGKPDAQGVIEHAREALPPAPTQQGDAI